MEHYEDHDHYGRTYHCAVFTKVSAANDFMGTHPEWGVLKCEPEFGHTDGSYDRIYVARCDDEGR